MDEMRAAYPAVWFEGCASGAMRLELASLTHFDNHFPTDTVNPVDVIRIMEGTSLRIVPGRIDRWLVLRSVGRTLPDYEPEEIPDSVATPVASGWQPRQFFESTDLDSASVAAMMGQFGMSGAPATLTATQRQRIGEHVAFYKQWREFITAGVFHQLTPVRPIEDRTGWSVVQVTGKTPDKSLVYALRLNDRTDRRRFTLHDLAAETNYAVSWHPRVEGALTCIRSGWELMEEGLDIVLPQPGNAAIAVIEKRG